MFKPISDFKIGWEKSYFKLESFHGEVTEWLNVAVSKTVVRESVPRVRIPLSPPIKNMIRYYLVLGKKMSLINVRINPFLIIRLIRLIMRLFLKLKRRR